MDAPGRGPEAHLRFGGLFPLKDNVPTDRFPLLTILLIVVNVGVFLWQQGYSGSDQLKERTNLSNLEKSTLEYGAIPNRLTHPDNECSVSNEGIECSKRAAPAESVPLDQPPAWLTVLTSMFMHGGLLHLAGNMLFLWIFGNNIEDSMGRLRFILFYLLGGIAAMAAQVAIGPDSTIPTVGASGAIAAVLGGYMLLYPRARVLTAVILIFFFTLIEIPAVVMLGIWIVMQFLPAVGQLAQPDIAGEGGVAYFAHIGGFLFGLILSGLVGALRNPPDE
jgi:membrane associated rhomboid family serine protease